MYRISIATDTALGLAYLHTADKVPLVHRNVKRWAFFRTVDYLLSFCLVQCKRSIGYDPSSQSGELWSGAHPRGQWL